MGTQFILFCIFSILFVVLLFGWLILVSKKNRKRQEEIHKRITSLQNNSIEVSPQEFQKMRKNSWYASELDFEGIYILHNQTKDKYYVGQGKQVSKRVNAHFSGRGNGDVYADYKYGDTFTIRLMALEDSGFDSLNELEKSAISFYNAYRNGYNRTRGNR